MQDVPSLYLRSWKITIAEKGEAVVKSGVRSWRRKDIFDIRFRRFLGEFD